VGRPRKNTVVFRAEEGSTAAKDASIKEIALKMAEGKWHPYRDALDYAATSGLSVSTVSTYAKEASRLLRIAWTDDSTRSVVVERIQKLGEDAANRTEEAVSKTGEIVTLRKPDYKSAIHAAEVLANILGMTKQQHEVRVSYERMSDDELMAAAMQHLQQGQSMPVLTAGTEIHNGTEGTDQEDQVEDSQPKGSGS